MCNYIWNVDCVRTTVQLWYNRFKEGREHVNDNARPDRPSTEHRTTDEDIEAVKKMILNNRRINIREVADYVGISFGSCQAIFTDVLGMKRVAAKIVPYIHTYIIGHYNPPAGIIDLISHTTYVVCVNFIHK